MAAAAGARRGRGRPPAGPEGQKRTQMRQMTARLPDADHRRLRALAAALEMSRSDVIAQSLRALEATLPKDLRTIVEQLTLKSRTRKVSPTRTRRR